MRILLKNKDRVLFFDKLGSFSNSYLAKYLETSRGMILRYKNGDLLMSEKRFRRLLELIPEESEYLIKKAGYKDENWGRIKGGTSTYSKRKDIFEKGRRIGLERILAKNKCVDLDIELTEDICEFIGAFIGDGFTNRYGHVSMTQIAGDKRYDTEYHSYLGSILEKRFGIKPRIYVKKETNELRTNFYSKGLFLFLVGRFSFPPGKKAKTVLIPNEIIHSNDPRKVSAVLRGIFDTDGSVYFDRRQIYKRKYPRIDLHLRNMGLIRQISEQLSGMDIPFSVVEGGYRLQINGISSIKKYISTIGFSNPRHIKKIKSMGLW